MSFSLWLLCLPGSAGSCRLLPCLPAAATQMERNISRFAGELGDAELAATFAQHAQRRLAAIDTLLWNARSGQWRDLWLDDEGPGGGEDGAADATTAGSSSSGDSGGGSCRVWARHRQSSAVAASNWVPLYCGCAVVGSPQADAALQALQRSGLLQPAGIAVSTQQTGQQWDWPNCWPPITCMLLEGCAEHCGEAGQQVGAPPASSSACLLIARSARLAAAGGAWRRALGCFCWTGRAVLTAVVQPPSTPAVPLCNPTTPPPTSHPHAPLPTQLAARLAQQYLSTAHAAWAQSGRMWEKFDAVRPGAPGGGGEYEVVDGFGWTNGVSLLLLERYGWQG